MILRAILVSFILTLFAASCAEKEQNQKAEPAADAVVQTPQTETKSEVPELWAFHDVIYQLWHEAWPAKDTEMLTQLIPEIEKGFAKLSAATLPGILRDKQTAWSEGIQKMKRIIEEYKVAAGAGEKEALLKTAEDLHTQFENLVRIVRPVMKEIDTFHQELYMLYHYYMPEYDAEKITSSTTELIKRMQALNEAQLPPRLKGKQQTFDQAKKSLNTALAQLQEAITDGSDKETVIAAIESVHTGYQELIGIFEK